MIAMLLIDEMQRRFGLGGFTVRQLVFFVMSFFYASSVSVSIRNVLRLAHAARCQMDGKRSPSGNVITTNVTQLQSHTTLF